MRPPIQIAKIIAGAIAAIAMIVLLGYLCSTWGLFARCEWLILLLPTAQDTLAYVGIWLVALVLVVIASGFHRVRRWASKR